MYNILLKLWCESSIPSMVAERCAKVEQKLTFVQYAYQKKYRNHLAENFNGKHDY